MGDIDYLKDIPVGTMLVDDKSAIIDHKTFERIGDYTRSMPTGPSPGRVYRKAMHWLALVNNSANPHYGEDPNWVIFLCERDPEDEKYVLHHPKKVYFLD